ncbi:Iron permease [Rhodovastum atsumiense]|uniref:Iron permease n=1 Tax=Rhodovastum atsumiense TaxID=504468 RepID=A0A5M6IT26_9PROT|nr:FTR1 family protein [Rhodovastum atsumiense]KAA5610977.1 iron permease [Rhodovastum atsumiense]CAH2600245.1 Iron permease [Rhodovastum atsumiense]
MLATLIIVFREVVEAGLIVGIVLAATEGMPGRGLRIAGGIAAGVAGACLVAAFAGAITDAFAGSGQELLNAAILGIAAVMLGWHTLWMARHGRAMAAELRGVGQEIVAGRRTPTALVVVVAMAVLREGAEVVLFLYGIAATGGTGAAGMFAGGLAGLALGAGLSVLAWAGMVRLPARALFAATGWLITLLAAGLAAQAAALLQQAGVVEALDATLWDSSALLSDASLPGRVLHTLIGYTDRPTGLQVLVYATTLFVLLLGARLTEVKAPRPARS